MIALSSDSPTDPSDHAVVSLIVYIYVCVCLCVYVFFFNVWRGERENCKRRIMMCYYVNNINWECQ